MDIVPAAFTPLLRLLMIQGSHCIFRLSFFVLKLRYIFLEQLWRQCSNLSTLLFVMAMVGITVENYDLIKREMFLSG